MRPVPHLANSTAPDQRFPILGQNRQYCDKKAMILFVFAKNTKAADDAKAAYISATD